jgi:hypothetical protein
MAFCLGFFWLSGGFVFGEVMFGLVVVFVVLSVAFGAAWCKECDDVMVGGKERRALRSG